MRLIELPAQQPDAIKREDEPGSHPEQAEGPEERFPPPSGPRAGPLLRVHRPVRFHDLSGAMEPEPASYVHISVGGAPGQSMPVGAKACRFQPGKSKKNTLELELILVYSRAKGKESNLPTRARKTKLLRPRVPPTYTTRPEYEIRGYVLRKK